MIYTENSGLVICDDTQNVTVDQSIISANYGYGIYAGGYTAWIGEVDIAGNTYDGVVSNVKADTRQCPEWVDMSHWPDQYEVTIHLIVGEIRDAPQLLGKHARIRENGRGLQIAGTFAGVAIGYATIADNDQDGIIVTVLDVGLGVVNATPNTLGETQLPVLYVGASEQQPTVIIGNSIGVNSGGYIETANLWVGVDRDGTPRGNVNSGILVQYWTLASIFGTSVDPMLRTRLMYNGEAGIYIDEMELGISLRNLEIAFNNGSGVSLSGFGQGLVPLSAQPAQWATRPTLGLPETVQPDARGHARMSGLYVHDNGGAGVYCTTRTGTALGYSSQPAARALGPVLIVNAIIAGSWDNGIVIEACPGLVVINSSVVDNRGDGIVVMSSNVRLISSNVSGNYGNGITVGSRSGLLHKTVVSSTSKDPSFTSQVQSKVHLAQASTDLRPAPCCTSTLPVTPGPLFNLLIYFLG